MRLTLTSGKHLFKIDKNSREEYFRPICRGEGEDLSLSLSERTGVMAGWGATEVTYSQTLCGYVEGVTDPNSGSNVLKKVEGLR